MAESHATIEGLAVLRPAGFNTHYSGHCQDGCLGFRSAAASSWFPLVTETNKTRFPVRKSRQPLLIITETFTSPQGELGSVAGGSTRTFACGGHGVRCRFPVGFLVVLPFTPLLHYAANPSPPHFTLTYVEDLVVMRQPKHPNSKYFLGAAVAQRLRHSPPTKVIRARTPAGSLPDFRMWESCWTIPLASGLSRGTPASPTSAFQHRSILGYHVMFRDYGRLRVPTGQPVTRSGDPRRVRLSLAQQTPPPPPLPQLLTDDRRLPSWRHGLVASPMPISPAASLLFLLTQGTWTSAFLSLSLSPCFSLVWSVVLESGGGCGRLPPLSSPSSSSPLPPPTAPTLLHRLTTGWAAAWLWGGGLEEAGKIQRGRDVMKGMRGREDTRVQRSWKKKIQETRVEKAIVVLDLGETRDVHLSIYFSKDHLNVGAVLVVPTRGSPGTRRQMGTQRAKGNKYFLGTVPGVDRVTSRTKLP
ncbi:hypothetical protein PR048_007941 [Dryococelus australis]|uniref:Uncharacterized protein n=1 Tax=Dryococelus australis TaxID=614101 RepID=A0ABQ9HVP5_9NEOP|nr:hypothetical protein PR048_007941 [Dryococelus australis]